MADVPFSQRVSAAENVLINVLDGEAVLLNLDNETYYGLDEVGARMWQVLMESDSIQSAYEALLDEYDVEPETLRADMRDLIARLVEQGLAELS
ncbi:MAG: PqqD family protein [Candidatus Brocadiaceae bacterium]|nr:PqqD family protein [Candidatus Brocadiaceae bacterium]